MWIGVDELARVLQLMNVCVKSITLSGIVTG
jgi:hypothetical protein